MRLADQTSSGPDGRRSSSKSSNIRLRTEASATTTPAAAFGQRRAGADLGLMSGRGLY